jgi:RNA polymerase sigma factor (sigma-70 family)
MADPTRPRRLPTTRWTLVLASDANSPEARAAWSSLCESYWYPVYSFIKRCGWPDEDARDLTQAFFTRALERNVFAKASRDRGRFRTFLLSAVRNFISNEYDRASAAKRGGDQLHVSIDADQDGRLHELADTDARTPDRLYDQAWAVATLAKAMTRLDELQSQQGAADRCHRLKPFLTEDGSAPYAELARDLKISEGAVRVAMHRLRRDYGECLREVVGETVDDPGQVDEELRHLLTVVSDT